MEQAEKKPQQIAKEGIVEALRLKMHEHSFTLLSDYKGITVSQDTAFRRKLREAGIDYSVARNTMIRLAAGEEGTKELDPFLKGTTAISFGNDPVQLAKIIIDFAKTNKNVKVKAGILDGKFISAEEVKSLSALPSREVLLSQVVGGMQAPLSGFAGALQGLLRNFVYCLSQIQEQKAS